MSGHDAGHLGDLRIADALRKLDGRIRGRVVTDAKDRYYARDYSFVESDGFVTVWRADGRGDQVKLPSVLPLDAALVAFFGLYSGDGSKGVEAPKDPNRIVPGISFSQREPNLVRFAVDAFGKIFGDNVCFRFTLGEDGAYFMAGAGEELLKKHYGGGSLPADLPLTAVRSKLDKADERYLTEVRASSPDAVSRHLAFYYQHKEAMREILAEEKRKDLLDAGIPIRSGDQVTASIRRPFKKGAREPGGSSRSDELDLLGLNGIGELFLKMIHDIEETLLADSEESASGLVRWFGPPSSIGDTVDVRKFFQTHGYGALAGERPQFGDPDGQYLTGKWPRSGTVRVRREVRMSPLWSFTSGLYLAEGTTPKEKLFSMYQQRPTGLAIGFTSSEGSSIELMLRALSSLFALDDCVATWKLKVGSQYFPELVVTGLKHGVPMLRGGASGDGKLRTMEISLALWDWAIGTADLPLAEGESSLLATVFADRFTHVEPTGAGVARIDFSTSSTLCRWYFPLIMFSVFGALVTKPAEGFY